MEQLALPGIILVLLLSSCSVEKGIYLSGYHFGSKNKNHSHKEQLVENTKPNESPSEDKKKDSTSIAQTSEPVVNNEILIANTTASSNNLIIPKVGWHQNNTTASIESEEMGSRSKRSTRTYKRNFSNDTDDKQLHWAAILGLITGIFGTGVCAIIFSTIAIVSITEKEKYGGMGISVAGFILGIIKITLIVLFITLTL